MSPIDAIASTYATDTIFILGKGPSADAVDPQVFAGSLVIALNDAERIAPADITVFHGDWVKSSIAEAGFRSRLYVTSTDFRAPQRQVLNRPHVPLTQESADLMIQRLQQDDVVLEDVLFMSALQIARRIAKSRGRTQTVYMVGFDFEYDPTHAYSQRLGLDYAPSHEHDRQPKILMQEYFFINALYVLKGSEIEVRHVGTKALSALTPAELNNAFLTQPVRALDAPHRVLVTAELTTNHFGDRLRLERMVRAAKAAGADLIKVQKRHVETFYSDEQLRSRYASPFGTTFGDYRRQLELDADDFAALDALCKQLDIDWFASVLDMDSFKFMLQFEPRRMKLPSTISEHTEYLSHVAANFGGAVVLSTGMTDTGYEQWVLETFKRCKQLYLMQANSAYPTPVEDCGIGVVRHYFELSRQEPRIVPAYSSHDFGWMASVMAVAAGAQMVEKHVKMGNTEWAHFDAVAIDLTGPSFKEYVDKVREAELIVGEEFKQVRSSEHHKYFRNQA
ncbi:MAG: N-acetylneuraminate synthase [Devosia sp.]|nr:N-acetylneuraminate synthase [Devosia sp.]